MQHAFSALNQFAPVVTSVMHGHHEGAASGPNEDPHYAGRAVDIGAFGSTPVGYNRTTWNALAAAIGSGQFSKVGTIEAIADSPQMQSWAKKNGVELFYDPGSGPHAHMEVAP